MSQPQPTMPQQRAAFSPQNSPSPHQATLTMPPQQVQVKRNHMSPTAGSSQPASPAPYPYYTGSPGITTPGTVTPTTGTASPKPQNQSYSNSQPQNTPSYNTPYQQNMQNGNGRPAGLTFPQAQPVSNNQTLTTPQHTPVAQTYSNASFAPAPMSMPVAPSAIGTMGPPSAYPNDASRLQPSAKPTTKSFAYDMDDTLAGTGINLEEEQQILQDLDTREGYAAGGTGTQQSFYGGGPANRPAEEIPAKTQEELAAEVADRTWKQAAHNLTVNRLQDYTDQFLAWPILHKRMDNVAGVYGLGLNTDMKNLPGGIGRPFVPHHATKPVVTVEFKKAPDGTMVRTSGSWIPKEAYLVDQLALLSIAAKERFSGLLGEANKLAISRQQTAHGVIPPEWADVAVPVPSGVANAEPDSALSPRTNPLKRRAKDISNGLPTPVSQTSPSNDLVESIVSAGKTVRSAEEARLRKRQKRMEKAADGEKKEDVTGPLRNGSIAPETPGSVAPELPESKAPTKKESKKSAKLAEASSSTVNSTLAHMMGGKKKKYSWMSGGAADSGASTPRPHASGLPGTAAATTGSKAVQGPLTQASAHHLGQFREDSEKGKNIQLRDWVNVLEEYGTDIRALQDAYIKLDRSDYGDKVATAPSPIPEKMA